MTIENWWFVSKISNIWHGFHKTINELQNTFELHKIIYLCSYICLHISPTLKISNIYFK